MSEKCCICKNEVIKENNKLNGTILKVKTTKGNNEFVYVCSDCQKDKDWIEKANVKSA